MSRDLGRRLARLEASEPRVVVLWLGDRDPGEVMVERFGSPEPPAGVRVFLLCWGDEQQGRALH